jgi:hypothetical protein
LSSLERLWTTLHHRRQPARTTPLDPWYCATWLASRPWRCPTPAARWPSGLACLCLKRAQTQHRRSQNNPPGNPPRPLSHILTPYALHPTLAATTDAAKVGMHRQFTYRAALSSFVQASPELVPELTWKRRSPEAGTVDEQ